MKEFTYVIQDAEGLHARPAGLIVKLAQTMDSRVTLTANEKTADCKRLFAVMKLAAKCGQELRVTVEGGDDLFGQPPSFEPIGYVADSEATTIAALKDDFNALLAALRSCGLMVTGK